MTFSFDRVKMAYYTIVNDGLNAVDISDSHISFSTLNKDCNMHIRLKIINYSNKGNKFNVRMHFSDSLKKLTGKEFYDLADFYHPIEGFQTFSFEKDIVVDPSYKEFMFEIFREPVVYELYNDKESIRIIQHEP